MPFLCIAYTLINYYMYIPESYPAWEWASFQVPNYTNRVNTFVFPKTSEGIYLMQSTL